jgi:hypothetical protein
MRTETAGINFDSDILPKLIEARQKRKGYASFFDWPYKAQKEKGIVLDLLEAIKANDGHHGIIKIRSNESDPPDCICTTQNGEYVGFEVTELVDAKTVKMNQRGIRTRKKWTSGELLSKLKEIIKTKDSKTYRGGPYSRIVLVIFTDEPLVRAMDCGAILRGRILGQCRSITDCYLLLSYQPGLKSYPYFKVELSRLV